MSVEGYRVGGGAGFSDNPLEASLPEMEHIICQLERGTVVTKFFQRKHPERRTLSVKRETRQVVWFKPMTRRNVYEGAGK